VFPGRSCWYFGNGIVQRHRGRYRYLSSGAHHSCCSNRITSRGGPDRGTTSSQLPATGL